MARKEPQPKRRTNTTRSKGKYILQKTTEASKKKIKKKSKEFDLGDESFDVKAVNLESGEEVEVEEAL